MTTPDYVKQLTNLLRMDKGPMWERMRVLFRGKGLDPATLVLADSFEDDDQFEFGLIVTPSGEVFQYGYDYRGKDISDGFFREWQNLTDRYKNTPYHEQIKIALKLVGS